MYRLQQSSDFESILKLDRRIFPADDPFEINELGAYWILHHRGRKVGFCALHPLVREPSVCFLARAGVLKTHQGKGMQKRMISTRVSYAKVQDFSHVLTYASLDNYPSLTNLIKSNFKLYDPAYKWAGRDVMYFIQDIRS